jgi:hypothetical protein
MVVAIPAPRVLAVAGGVCAPPALPTARPHPSTRFA